MSKYDVDSGIGASIDPKCEGLLKALRGKSLDLTKTGHKEINFLVKAITCQAKASREGAKELAQYELCHKSVMGTGSFKGQASCGDYLTKLLAVVCQHGQTQRPGRGRAARLGSRRPPACARRPAGLQGRSGPQRSPRVSQAPPTRTCIAAFGHPALTRL